MGPVAAGIYGILSKWCAAIEDEAATTEPKLPAGIVSRAAECWEPLCVVVDLAGGSWPERVRKAAIHFIAGNREESTTPGTELLEHIRAAFGQEDKLYTTTLLNNLHERPDSPWKDIRGKPLDDRGLAKRLRGLGIKSRDVWIGNITKKGYYAADFEDNRRRYLQPLYLKGGEGEEIDIIK